MGTRRPHGGSVDAGVSRVAGDWQSGISWPRGVCPSITSRVYPRRCRQGKTTSPALSYARPAVRPLGESRARIGWRCYPGQNTSRGRGGPAAGKRTAAASRTSASRRGHPKRSRERMSGPLHAIRPTIYPSGLFGFNLSPSMVRCCMQTVWRDKQTDLQATSPADQPGAGTSDEGWPEPARFVPMPAWRRSVGLPEQGQRPRGVLAIPRPPTNTAPRPLSPRRVRVLARTLIPSYTWRRTLEATGAGQL